MNAIKERRILLDALMTIEYHVRHPDGIENIEYFKIQEEEFRAYVEKRITSPLFRLRLAFARMIDNPLYFFFKKNPYLGWIDSWKYYLDQRRFYKFATNRKNQ